MPLFQPSNITPSSFAGVGSGTVDATQSVKITWQVNGNVPMTAFKIDIFDMQNKSVYSGTAVAITPFYPTDNKGNPQYYTYEPPIIWQNMGVSNGKEYTLQITQYWGNVIDNEHSVTQFSQSYFITRATPTLSILKANGESSFTTINSVSQNFTTAYSQEQNDSIDWVRWKLYQIIDGKEYLIDDTGIVNTQLLSYLADNLRSGNTYKIVSIIQTESGVEIQAEKQFNVSYELEEIEGVFNCDVKDTASNLLEWAQLAEIKGDDIPGVNVNSYSFDNGQLVLPKNSSVTWNTKNNSALSISANWTMEWRGNAKADYSLSETFYKSPVTSIATSGNIVVISTSGGTRTFLIEGDELVSTAGISGSNLYLKFSSNGKYLVSYVNKSKLVIYSVDTNSSGGVTFTQIGTIDEKIVNAFDFISSEELMVGFQNQTTTGYIKYYRLSESGIISYTTNYFPEFNTAVTGIKARKDGKYVIISGGYHSVALYQLNGFSPTFKSTFSNNGNTITSIGDIAFLNKRDAFFVSAGGNVLLYSISNTTSPLQTITASGRIYCDREDLSLFIGFGQGAESIIQSYSLDNNGIAEYVNEKSIDSSMGNYVAGIGISDNDKFMIIGTGVGAYIWQMIAPETKTVLKANNLVCEIDKGFSITYNSTNLINVPHSEKICEYLIGRSAIEISAISINKNRVSVVYNRQEKQNNITFTQNAITEVSILGEQTCKYLYIASGISIFPENFVPEWNTDTKLLTHFNLSTLQAGQLGVVETIRDIYRENVTTNTLEKLYSCNDELQSIKDYGWLPNVKYNYYAYTRLENKYTSANKFNQSVVYRKQPYYLLLETIQDENQPNAYHVINWWRFGNNLSAGSVSNNNSPNFLENFTGYRLKQPSARIGKSGTLNSLLSNVEKFDYNDTVEQMQALFNLSKSENTLFLKDMKGNISMIAISSPITQTVNTKSFKQETTISLPWEEIGSCEGISIIQTSNDIGWEE